MLMMRLTKFIVGLAIVGLIWFPNPNNDKFEPGLIILKVNFVPRAKATK